MATNNLKLIAIIVLAQLIFSCKPTRYTSVVNGKSIPVKLQYNKPFKLGDTLFLSFKCSVTDLVNSTNSPVGNFKTYTVYGVPFVSKKDSAAVVADDGKYIKNGKDIPGLPPIEYNFVTGNFEYNYGYIPFKKGIYQIQNSSLSIFPNSNKYPSWNLPMYYEGDSPATSDRYKYFEVE